MFVFIVGGLQLSEILWKVRETIYFRETRWKIYKKKKKKKEKRKKEKRKLSSFISEMQPDDLTGAAEGFEIKGKFSGTLLVSLGIQAGSRQLGRVEHPLENVWEKEKPLWSKTI